VGGRGGAEAGDAARGGRRREQPWLAAAAGGAGASAGQAAPSEACAAVCRRQGPTAGAHGYLQRCGSFRLDLLVVGSLGGGLVVPDDEVTIAFWCALQQLQWKGEHLLVL